MDQSNTNTQAPAEQKQDTIDLVDLKVLSDSLAVVNTALNVATTKGSFNLDEAFKVKISLNNTIKACETLEKCQNLLIKAQGQNSTPPPIGKLDTTGLGLDTTPAAPKEEQTSPTTQEEVVV